MKLLKSKNLCVEKMILIILAIIRVFYYISLKTHYSPDSYEYINVNGLKIFEGTVNRYRLPLYPFLIDLFKIVFKSNYLDFLCLFQLAISLISIYFFYLTILKVINNKYIALLTTTMYALFCGVCGWEKTILTESLSLSFTVFIIYCLVSYIKNAKLKYIIYASIFVIFGVMLRAVFAIYAVFILSFLLMYFFFCEDKSKTTKKINLTSAAFAFVPIILILLYASAFSQQYGVFTLSESALGQELYVVLQEGYYKNSDDIELVEAANEIINNATDEEIEKNVKEMLASLYNSEEIDATILHETTNSVKHNNSDIIIDEKYESSIRNIIHNLFDNDEYSCGNFPRLFLARVYLMENYDVQRISDFVKQAKNENFADYIFHGIAGINEYYSSYSTEGAGTFFGFYIFVNSLVLILRLSVLHCLMFANLDFVLFLRKLLKEHKLNWIKLGLSVFVFATIFLSMYKTNAEFARTSITALPFTFVSIGIYINRIFKRINKKQS